MSEWHTTYPSDTKTRGSTVEMLEKCAVPMSESDDRSRTADYPFLSEGVQLELKLNVQCPEGDVASAKLSALMGTLERQMCKEATAVVDELSRLSPGEAELVYLTSRKVRLANDGTCAYVRLALKTTRVVSYPGLAKLAEHIVAAFVEKASELMYILNEYDGSTLKVALAGVEDLLLDPGSTLRDLIGTSQPRPDDQA